MARHFTVTLTSGTNSGPYEVYYDSIDLLNFALLYGTTNPATNLTLSQVQSGVLVTVPTGANSVILYNTNPQVGTDCPTNFVEYSLGSSPTSTPMPTATSAPTATPGATSAPTATPGATSAPTATPAPTSTSAPTATPAPTSTPGVTPNPTASPTPTQTEALTEAFCHEFMNEGDQDVVVSIVDANGLNKNITIVSGAIPTYYCIQSYVDPGDTTLTITDLRTQCTSNLDCQPNSPTPAPTSTSAPTATPNPTATAAVACIEYTYDDAGSLGDPDRTITFTNCDGNVESFSFPAGGYGTFCAQQNTVLYPPTTTVTDSGDCTSGGVGPTSTPYATPVPTATAVSTTCYEFSYSDSGSLGDPDASINYVDCDGVNQTYTFPAGGNGYICARSITSYSNNCQVTNEGVGLCGPTGTPNPTAVPTATPQPNSIHTFAYCGGHESDNPTAGTTIIVVTSQLQTAGMSTSTPQPGDTIEISGSGNLGSVYSWVSSSSSGTPSSVTVISYNDVVCPGSSATPQPTTTQNPTATAATTCYQFTYDDSGSLGDPDASIQYVDCDGVNQSITFPAGGYGTFCGRQVLSTSANAQAYTDGLCGATPTATPVATPAPTATSVPTLTRYYISTAVLTADSTEFCTTNYAAVTAVYIDSVSIPGTLGKVVYTNVGGTNVFPGAGGRLYHLATTSGHDSTAGGYLVEITGGEVLNVIDYICGPSGGENPL